jgi:hypothetical protein
VLLGRGGQLPPFFPTIADSSLLTCLIFIVVRALQCEILLGVWKDTTGLILDPSLISYVASTVSRRRAT